MARSSESRNSTHGQTNSDQITSGPAKIGGYEVLFPATPELERLALEACRGAGAIDIRNIINAVKEIELNVSLCVYVCVCVCMHVRLIYGILLMLLRSLS